MYLAISNATGNPAPGTHHGHLPSQLASLTAYATKSLQMDQNTAAGLVINQP